MTDLVIVYHRQPFEEVLENGQTVLREPRSPNGIIPALKGFFQHAEHAVWLAWKKAPAGRAPKFARRVQHQDAHASYEVERLPLDATQISQFYHVVSKEALWPVINSFPAFYSTENTQWSVFREVSRLFAEAACELADQGAVVWMHDYNLWLVPGMIRARRPDLKLAFFHHTAFPGPDIFNILPWRQEILDSLLCCDRIGFHVPRYANNFAAVVRGLGAGWTAQRAAVADGLLAAPSSALADREQVVALQKEGHTVHLDALPIGITPSAIAAQIASPQGQERLEQTQAALAAAPLIVSISRVDYVKGTRQQLEAFERLLRRRPELVGHVRLLLVTVAPADGMQIYRAAQQQIEQLVGRINGHFGTLDWMPVVLSTTPLGFEEVVAVYRSADIAWITPLRDGLNLVAKEYVAARAGLPGVLVLSEFAGVAVELDGALLVNPFSRDAMDRAIDAAIDMPVAERRDRMARMQRQVQQHDMAAWTERVLQGFAELR